MRQVFRVVLTRKIIQNMVLGPGIPEPTPRPTTKLCSRRRGRALGPITTFTRKSGPTVFGRKSYGESSSLQHVYCTLMWLESQRFLAKDLPFN